VVNNVVLFLGLNPCGDKLFMPHFDGVLAVGLLLHVGPRLVYDIFFGSYVVTKKCNWKCLATIATFMTFLYFVTKFAHK
jgi:hypothetical protein